MIVAKIIDNPRGFFKLTAIELVNKRKDILRHFSADDIFGVTMTGGMIPYTLTYAFGDIITEVYGYKRARQLIWGTIICNLFVVSF